MKRITILIAVITLSVWAVSCDTFVGDSGKKTSTGKAYEVFVVMRDSLWNDLPGDTLRSFFWEPFPMVNQYEPLYSVYQSDPAKFTGLLRQFRNVLVYQTDPKFAEPSMKAEYDKWAEPQIVVYVTGPSDSVLIDYMDWNKDALQGIFDITEQARFLRTANVYADPVIKEKAMEHFGLQLNIPKGYKVAMESDDFMWIRYELPLISQGIVIYKYPLTNRYAFTPDSLLANRNRFVSRIPGPSEGSHMTTSNIFVPEVSQTQINGRIWFMSQGFWDVAGDYMGGPFTSYSTVNATTREIITIDTYVFSPKYDKRNYVRQLQSFAQTAAIPGDTVATINWAEFEIPEESTEINE